VRKHAFGKHWASGGFRACLSLSLLQKVKDVHEKHNASKLAEHTQVYIANLVLKLAT